MLDLLKLDVDNITVRVNGPFAMKHPFIKDLYKMDLGSYVQDDEYDLERDLDGSKKIQTQRLITFAFYYAHWMSPNYFDNEATRFHQALVTAGLNQNIVLVSTGKLFDKTSLTSGRMLGLINYLIRIQNKRSPTLAIRDEFVKALDSQHFITAKYNVRLVEIKAQLDELDAVPIQTTPKETPTVVSSFSSFAGITAAPVINPNTPSKREELLGEMERIIVKISDLNKNITAARKTLADYETAVKSELGEDIDYGDDGESFTEMTMSVDEMTARYGK